MHPASRGERARSLRYELDDVNLKDFPAPLVIDPNLVSESQYRGEEPPEYWGNDGEFTFVPRKDCQYLQVIKVNLFGCGTGLRGSRSLENSSCFVLTTDSWKDLWLSVIQSRQAEMFGSS